MRMWGLKRELGIGVFLSRVLRGDFDVLLMVLEWRFCVVLFLVGM